MMTGVYLPDLVELKLFDTVVRQGSISAAARETGVSQQAVSARLRALERRLGIVLLARSRVGAAPTQAGSQLLPAVRTVLDAAARLAETIAHHRDTESSLAIAASQTIASHLLPTWLLRFREHQLALGRLPAVTELHTGNSERVMRLVRDGTVDIGFIETPLLPADLGTSTVSGDRLVAVVAATHPWAHRTEISLAELANTPLVVREAGSGTRVAYERMVREVLHQQPTAPLVVLSTEAAVRSAVAGGLAPSVLSELTVRDDVRLGRVRALPIHGADLSRPLTAVWRGGARDLLGLIRELVEVASAAPQLLP